MINLYIKLSVCVPRLIPGRGFYAQISSEITSEFPGVTDDEEEEKKDKEQKDLSIAPCMLEECLIDQALVISEDEKKGNDNGATTTQGMHIYDVPTMSTTYAIL